MCGVDRWDFNADDSPLYPMYVTKGGDLYGFCPGKASWDNEIVALFNELVLVAHLQTMPDGRPIDEQPEWYVELLTWFLPRYDAMKFGRNIDMIFGGSDKKKPKTDTPRAARPQRQLTHGRN